MSALTRSSTSWEHTRWGVQHCSGYRGNNCSCIPRPQCLLPALFPAPSTGPPSSRSRLLQVAALAPCRHGEGCVVWEGREVGSGHVQVAALAPRWNAHCIPILTLARPPAPPCLPTCRTATPCPSLVTHWKCSSICSAWRQLPPPLLLPLQDSDSLPVPRALAVLEYLLCLAATLLALAFAAAPTLLPSAAAGGGSPAFVAVAQDLSAEVRFC